MMTDELAAIAARMRSQVEGRRRDMGLPVTNPNITLTPLNNGMNRFS